MAVASSSAGAALSLWVEWQWRVVGKCHPSEIERQLDRTVSYNDQMNFGGVGKRLTPAVLKTVRPERVSWVRIPPPPPFFVFCFHLVHDLRCSTYLWCTLRLEEDNGILRPSASNIGLGLLLALSNPRVVVLLGYLDAGVSKQD